MGGWIVSAVIAVGAWHVWTRWRRLARAEFIRTYTFPRGLFDKLQEQRPALDAKQMQLVARGLRQFFLAHLHSGCKYVSMPSRVADDLWHEFILHTRAYDAFCGRAFGRFMHHTPAVALGASHQNNAGLRRTWWYACKDENISPRRPTRLPLLFALDAKLGIAGGFIYTPDCRKLRDEGGWHSALRRGLRRLGIRRIDGWFRRRSDFGRSIGRLRLWRWLRRGLMLSRVFILSMDRTTPVFVLAPRTHRSAGSRPSER